MKNKVIILSCYFGKLSNYFQLWLDSCKLNSDFTWVLFTDDNDFYDYPINVKKIDISFGDFVKYIEKKLGYKISIKDSYKLCDYKVAYGEIFNEYIQNYTHWGHCDLDTIWGDLSKFITDEILDRYDRVFTYGHLSIYKNNLTVNGHYKYNYSGVNYKDIFTSPVHYGFDEMKGLTQLYKDNNLLAYDKSIVADINFLYYEFLVNKSQNYKGQFFRFDNGKLFRCDLQGNVIDEFGYIHLQKRKMENNIFERPSVYTIKENGFYKENDTINTDISIKERKIYTFNMRIKVLKIKIRWNVYWKIKYSLAAKRWKHGK